MKQNNYFWSIVLEFIFLSTSIVSFISSTIWVTKTILIYPTQTTPPDAWFSRTIFAFSLLGVYAVLRAIRISGENKNE